MRAMREARYEQRRAGAAKPTTAPRAAKRVAPEPVDTQPPAASSEVEPCGHRAISGRTCTREKGHAAKSHRYS